MSVSRQVVSAAAVIALYGVLSMQPAAGQARSEAETASHGAAVLRGEMTRGPQSPQDGRSANPIDLPRSEAQAAAHGAAVLQPGHQAAPPMRPDTAAPPMPRRSAAETAAHGRDVSR